MNSLCVFLFLAESTTLESDSCVMLGAKTVFRFDSAQRAPVFAPSQALLSNPKVQLSGRYQIQMSAGPTTLNKNFGLSEAEFKQLQEALQQGDQRLFEQIFLSHFERCRSLLTIKYSAPPGDTYDVVMWSLIQFRHLLVEGKVAYGNLEAYFMRIAVSKYLREQNSGKEIPTATLPEELDLPTPYLEDEETLAVLAKAWSRLGDICRQLLKGFYYDKLDLRSITALIGDSSEANTRQRKVRCIKELRKIFFELEG